MNYINAHIGGIRFALAVLEVATFVIIAIALTSIAISLKKRNQ